jgi:osmotically-inducible protein OsmY
MKMTSTQMPAENATSDRQNANYAVRAELERLLRTGAAAQDIDCDIDKGILILRGTVPSFHSKQMAQETSRKVDGIRRIVNRLLVDRSHLLDSLRDAIPFQSTCHCAAALE